MARYKILDLKIFLCVLPFVLGAGQDNTPQLDGTLEAYHSFWDTFDKRQKDLIDAGQKKYESSWKDVEEKHKKTMKALSVKKLEAIKAAVSGYRYQLEKIVDSENRPYVLLNLAQSLFL